MAGKLDLAAFARNSRNMRTIAVIFLLALIAITGEIYSDAVLTRGQVSPSGPRSLHVQVGSISP
jgi:hypothetical protein